MGNPQGNSSANNTNGMSLGNTNPIELSNKY
jgi:hypothetical protein